MGFKRQKRHIAKKKTFFNTEKDSLFFSKFQKVEHKIFGVGSVLSSSKDTTTVIFDCGIKKIKTNFLVEI